MNKYISTWKELRTLKSDTHYLEITEYNAWVHPKDKTKYLDFTGHHYLSSRSFHGDYYEDTILILKKCGFDVSKKIK